MKSYYGLIVLVLAGCMGCKQQSQTSNESKPEYKDLTLEQFMVAYGQELKDSAMLIDLRTPPEFNDGYIKGAVMINFLESDIDHQLDMLDRKIGYYIYCQQGARSNKCIEKMKRMGFKRVYSLIGGYEAYTSMTGK